LVARQYWRNLNLKHDVRIKKIYSVRAANQTLSEKMGEAGVVGRNQKNDLIWIALV
jgi:hypothetical protein